MKPDCLIDSLSRLLTSVSTYSITMLCLCIMHIIFTVHVSISKTDISRLIADTLTSIFRAVKMPCSSAAS